MTDTLILGGGLAGAAAALWLADHGHGATIIEARPRLGGRARSRDWGEAGVVEYGGGWVRADHTLMHGLAARLGIPLAPRAALLDHSYFRDGTSHADPAEDMAEYDAALSRFQADATLIGTDNHAAQALQGMTLQAYLNDRSVPKSLRREILAWWSISGSGSPASVGVNELLTGKLAAGFDAKLQELAFTVQDGVTGLVEAAACASGADLVLGDPAERLTEGPEGVRLTLASGRVLRARTALVALPLNCLNQLRFTPPLNKEQNALRQLGHDGRARKVLIRARGPRPGQLATGHAAGLRWIYADRLLADGSTLVIGFGLQTVEGDPTEADIRAALAAAFPGADYIDHDWHDWCADPFARGTWVSPYLGLLPCFAAEHWGPRGRLAFAGSDLYSAEQGWFEGALLTARDAVAALHDRLQRA
jgi:monoamine oxidase